MLSLPAPKYPSPPEPDRPAPPGFAWWAWHTPAGPFVAREDDSGKALSISRPVERIGYVLGTA
jgi:hypothetical protein